MEMRQPSSGSVMAFGSVLLTHTHQHGPPPWHLHPGRHTQRDRRHGPGLIVPRGGQFSTGVGHRRHGVAAAQGRDARAARRQRLHQHGRGSARRAEPLYRPTRPPRCAPHPSAFQFPAGHARAHAPAIARTWFSHVQCAQTTSPSRSASGAWSRSPSSSPRPSASTATARRSRTNR